MKRMITYYLKPYYFRMGIGFLIKFCGTIMDLCIPWVLAFMIDTVIPAKEQEQILIWGAVMLLCSVLAVSFNIMANRMASRVAAAAAERIRHDLFEKTMRLSAAQTDQFTKPSLISRLTTDTWNVHQMIGRIQRLGVRAPILLIGGILVTLTLDPYLAGILLIIMPILAVLLFFISRKGIPLYQALQHATDHLVRLVREDISGIRIIKALSRTGTEKQKFDRVNHNVMESERKAEKTMAVINPSMNILLNLGLVAVIIAGASRVNTGTSEVGKILAFMTYFTIILHAVMSLSKMFVILSKAIASAGRIDEILACGEELTIRKDMTDCGADEDYIVFDQVSFSYHKQTADIEDISFRMKRGETLGIIGSTGAGKSTVVSLLMRLYDADSGRILIGGKDVTTIDEKELRQKFGVTFQNDTIFEDTIHNNVALGRGLSEETVAEALRFARAEEFVQKKENRQSGKLNIRGANLSGGQKQRILIARALCAHPEILILDDSSSALDYKTDAALRSELNTHFPDTTTIVIAQRISSIRQADHILVMENGRMTGYGTHEELLNSCEAYREIGMSQMGIVQEA